MICNALSSSRNAQRSDQIQVMQRSGVLQERKSFTCNPRLNEFKSKLIIRVLDIPCEYNVYAALLVVSRSYLKCKFCE